MNTNRHALGQVILCKGCCCGQTERGKPEVPVDRIKEIWKREKLNRSVQLTVSGCLGPCDVANVVLLMTADGAEWLGGIAGNAEYDDLIQWARDCHAAGAVLPLPESLGHKQLNRFTAKEAIA